MMELYHGSNIRIEKPDFAFCKPFKDFGKGFYLSAEKEQALDLAKQRVRETHEGEPIINVFSFDESLMTSGELKVLTFDDYSEEWVKFVLANRDLHGIQPYHNYDIVYGPIADDSVTFQLRRYQRGVIRTIPELYHYFIQEGLAWRITPFYIKENKQEYGITECICDTEKMYDNMMNKYRYGNTSMPGIYLDETVSRMCTTHRRCFAKLATQLIAEGKKDKALKVLERCDKEIPSYNLPYSYSEWSFDIANAYLQCGRKDKAEKIYNQLETTYNEYKKWQQTK